MQLTFSTREGFSPYKEHVSMHIKVRISGVMIEESEILKVSTSLMHMHLPFINSMVNIYNLVLRGV